MFINQYEIYDICKIIDLFNNNSNNIKINNCINNQTMYFFNDISFCNYNQMLEKNISNELNKTNQNHINNTISQNNYNFYKVINDLNRSEKKKKKMFKVITKYSRYKGVSKNKKKISSIYKI